MGLGTNVGTELDTATPWLAELQERVTPHEIASEVGPRCTRLIQRNFRSLGTNEKGWPSTHFYGRAAEATNWQEGFGFVMISVNQMGIRQRLMGGPIRPVNKEALTIPISPLSYGHRVADFPGAFLLCTPKGAWIVQYGTGTGGTKAAVGKANRAMGGNWKQRQKATLNFLFVLSKGVTQTANSRVMPSDEDFNEEFDRSVDVLLRRAEEA